MEIYLSMEITGYFYYLGKISVGTAATLSFRSLIYLPTPTAQQPTRYPHAMFCLADDAMDYG